MSMCYDGVLVAAGVETVRKYLSSNQLPEHRLSIVPLRTRLTAIFRASDATRAFDTDAVTTFASATSSSFGSSLAVFYDDRIGLRASVLYANGVPIKQFGEEDELWVPLLTSGEPDTAARPLHASELLSGPEHEYETIANAIALGISALDPTTDVTASELRDAVEDADE
jgi:hypothetical protein